MLKSDLVQTDKHSIIILLRRKNLLKTMKSKLILRHSSQTSQMRFNLAPNLLYYQNISRNFCEKKPKKFEFNTNYWYLWYK
jgi:hypothetical protein